MPTLVCDPGHKSSRSTLLFFRSPRGVAEFAQRSRISKVLRNAPRTEYSTEYPTEFLPLPLGQSVWRRNTNKTKKKSRKHKRKTDNRATTQTTTKAQSTASEGSTTAVYANKKKTPTNVCSRLLLHVQVPTLNLCASTETAPRSEQPGE